MRKVLIVSYAYPPIQAIGALRVASFVRHLPKFGWQPYVLTIKQGPWTPTKAPPPSDESQELVCRTPSLDISRVVTSLFGKTFRGGGVTRDKATRSQRRSLTRLSLQVYDNLLAFPDSAWPWFYLGRGQALEFARRTRPDAILSSSVPLTSHTMASFLQEKLNVPWLADFRDLWSQNCWIDYPPFARRRRERLERMTLRNAAGIVSTSEPHAQELKRLHNKPVRVVANGFEPDDYALPAPLLPKFTISYTGTLFPGKLDPRLFFTALKSLADEGAIAPDNFQVLFYGLNHDITKKLARLHGVIDFVHDYGEVPRKRSLEAQKESHALLLLEWTDLQAKGGIPGKLFEYLGSRRPILAIGPKGGAIDAILRDTGSGEVVCRVEQIKEKIITLFNAHRKGSPLSSNGSAEKISQYTRERQAEILADFLSIIA